MRRALVAFAVSMLTGLVILTPGAAVAKTPDCASVDFMQACTEFVEVDFTDTVLCDFPVEVHVDIRNRYRPFFANDGSGNLASDEFHFRFDATIVNPATGRSFFDGSNFNLRATFLPDGSVEIRETGILHNAVVDDGQRLFHQSGNHSLLQDPAENVIAEAFHGNWESEAAFPGNVCPILAEPR